MAGTQGIKGPASVATQAAGQAAMPTQGIARDIPATVQRMPGGFGLSPQLLQMIAALQTRSQPQGSPAPFNAQPFLPKPRIPIIGNPYSDPTQTGPNSWNTRH